MRLKLFLLLIPLFGLSVFAQRTGIQGIVVDAESGLPISGASIILDNQNILVNTGPAGDFLITNAAPGTDNLSIVSYGHKDWSEKVEITQNVVEKPGYYQTSRIIILFIGRLQR